MIDFSPLLKPIFSALYYLIPLAILASIVKSAWFKGKAGEFLVNLSARLFLNGKEYRLIKNVTLHTEDGTTQIDHIVVSIYGVFVIETKNMSGWIFGNAHQKIWTQKIYRQTYKFQNPLHQNYKHTKTLEHMLGIDPNHIFSVVVFVGDSAFKTEMPDNVVEAGGYIGYIKSKRTPLWSEAEAERICTAIESGRLAPSFKTHREHVKNLRAAHESRRTAGEKICKRCGKPMILRRAKTGATAGNAFWGCSGYPQCRETMPS